MTPEKWRKINDTDLTALNCRAVQERPRRDGGVAAAGNPRGSGRVGLEQEIVERPYLAFHCS